ncbi:MAG: tRNA guanosine(34) transglycosylase Tgt [Firmicutes bacterium]|nr:tRNA guanosine(34) transglycosylase Tgt [Bacillota bacterium]
MVQKEASMRIGLATPHGRIEFPAFLPDATYGAVKAADSADLRHVKVQALVMNAYHLMQKPGTTTVLALGGLHEMSGWHGPIMTDSGGFQAYSVIRQDPSRGSVGKDGITVLPEGASRKFALTPEKAVQLQLAYGADIVVCLDECTHPDDSRAVQEAAVARTLRWAARCREEFDRLVSGRKLGDGDMRPRIFAVVQGGNYPDLRESCARELTGMGFDGMGFGGWPMDGEGNLLKDILRAVRGSLPEDMPLHALGIGHPKYVVDCWNMGYDMFDCSLPTRDARRGRLYLAEGGIAGSDFRGRWFRHFYMQDDKHMKDRRPVMRSCDCPACANYSAGYLHHLMKNGEALFQRLATLHNLRFMTMLSEELRRRGRP